MSPARGTTSATLKVETSIKPRASVSVLSAPLCVRPRRPLAAPRPQEDLRPRLRRGAEREYCRSRNFSRGLICGRPASLHPDCQDYRHYRLP